MIMVRMNTGTTELKQMELQLGREYFVWRKPETLRPFRVVRREVRDRTHKGYPISYVLKSIPDTFENWEKAQSTADFLNQLLLSIESPDWIEEELAEIS
jgi:hypothetical protein